MNFTFATNSETGIFKTALPAGIPTHTKVPLSGKYMMAWLNGVISPAAINAASGPKPSVAS